MRTNDASDLPWDAEVNLAPLPAGWRYVPPADIVEAERPITYGIVQPGAETPAGVPIARVQDIEDGRVDTSSPLRVDPAIAAKYRRTMLRGGELLLTLVGAVGEAAITPPEVKEWNTARAVAVIPVRPEPGAQFVQYAIRTPQLQHLILAWCITTVQATFNLKEANQLPIPLPPRGEREAIVRILRVLDDKIEVNRWMNQTLEGLAGALFKSWFVDFDPVVAKAAGKKPVGMSAQTAALFPDRFQDSTVGPIPRGWDVEAIGQLVDVVGGSTPSTTTSTFWEGGTIAWATPKNLSNIADPMLMETERKIPSAGLDQISSGLLPKGAVLMSSRAPIGYLAIAEIPVAVNQGFIAIKCGRAMPNLFVLFWAQANMDEIESRVNGTTFMEISKANFRPIPAVVPSLDVMRCFHSNAERLFSRIVANIRQSRSLAAVRDALLPQLMSGKLRVANAERIVEGVE